MGRVSMRISPHVELRARRWRLLLWGCGLERRWRDLSGSRMPMSMGFGWQRAKRYISSRSSHGSFARIDMFMVDFESPE